MKNMFFVINKEKVYAYVVSILTIVTLFFMSHVLNTDLLDTEQTSGNLEQNINITNAINNTQNENMENNAK